MIRLALLILLAAAPARAFLGLGGQRSAGGRTALVFVPDTEHLDWDALAALLLRFPDAGFTLALPPADVPEDARMWLKEWAAKEHAEVALRIAGDPLLPLIARHRARDAVDRVALARVAYRTLFGEYPAGLVPGGGLLTPAQALTLERQRFIWAAVGESEFSSPWYGDKSTIMLPFSVPRSTAAVDLAPKGLRALLLSEIDGPLAPGEGLARLEELLAKRGDEFSSVVRALEGFTTYAVGPEEWRGFHGPAALFTETPLQRKAWRLYYAAAQALADYQNSGSARLGALNKATAALHQAQTHWYYRPTMLRGENVDKAFRGRLKQLYRLIGLRLPKELWRPMTHGLADEPESLDEAEVLAQTRGRVLRGRRAGALWFDNPEGSRASAPKPALDLAPGTTAHYLFTPRRLAASWTDDELRFRFLIKELFAVDPDRAPNGFDHLSLELYMDLNNLAGRGATALLPGRRGFIAAEDAWEYVLVVNGWRARMWRSVPGQAPVAADDVPVTIDVENAAIEVTVPRRRLRGNPAAWGYLLVSTGVDADAAVADPPRALAGETGSPLLGMIGSLDEQKSLAEADYNYRRFTALRAGDEESE